MTILPQLEQDLYEAARECLPTREHASETGAPSPDATPPRFRWPLRRGGRKAVNVIVFAALAAVGAFLVIRSTGLGSSGRALAATPLPLHYISPGPDAPSGRQELLRLAAAAARQPAARTKHPRYAYTKTRGWYLDSEIGGGSTTSFVMPETSESWLAPNDSGRVRTIRQEPNGSTNVDDFNPGAGIPLPRLSTHAPVLARQLARRWPASIGSVERFVALTELAGQQPIPAHVEAAFLRLFARAPGLVNSGAVIDRAGRRGVAISLDSAYSGLPTRYTYIFDRRTGRLLDEEETLLGNPGELNVRPRAVIAYTTFLASAYVKSTSSRP